MHVLVAGPRERVLVGVALLLAHATIPLLADGQGDPSPGKKANDRSTIQINGYTHTDIIVGPAAPAAGPLALRRATIAFSGRSRDRIDARFQYAFDRFQPHLKDLYVTGYTPHVGVRVGQFKVPFSEEILLSSAERETLERSPLFDRLWPRQRDRGIAVTYRPQEKHGGQMTVAVLLGNGPNRWDNNAAKDVVVRCKQLFDDSRGAMFVGYQAGTFTDGAGVTTARRTIGGGGAWRSADSDWKLYSEAYVGQALGAGVVGGFARAVHAFGDGDHRVYAQLDYTDLDTATPGDSQLGPLVGYIWQAGNDTKFTLEFNGRQNQATAGRDFAAGLRCQIDFD